MTKMSQQKMTEMFVKKNSLTAIQHHTPENFPEGICYMFYSEDFSKL